MNTAEVLLKNIQLNSTSVVSQPTEVYIKASSGTASTPNLTNVISFDGTNLFINFKTIYDWAITQSPSYEPSLGDKQTLILSDNLIFKYDKKTTSAQTFTDIFFNFASGSSSYEGVINLY